MREFACVVVLIIALLGPGCTHTVVKRVARYDLSSNCEVAVAPRTGVYKVKYVSSTAQQGRSVVNSSRTLLEGQRIGFRRADDGRIFAFAGDEEFELDDLPADVTRCCWYHRSKEPTQFAKNCMAA